MSKVLIVEDEKTLAKMYREVFENEGYEVSLASKVDQALELAKEINPDLIMLDILLPGETGISFLKQLRNLNDPAADSLVVAFSNYDDQESKEDALDLGAKDYLIKTNNTPKEIVEKSIKYLE